MTFEESKEYLVDLVENTRFEKEPYEMAIEALEKQIPKKPIDRCMFHEFPSCGNVEIQVCSYCPNCGQKLDWK